MILAACCLSTDFEYYCLFPLLDRMTLSDDQMSMWRFVIYFVDYREHHVLSVTMFQRNSGCFGRWENLQILPEGGMDTWSFYLHTLLHQFLCWNILNQILNSSWFDMDTYHWLGLSVTSQTYHSSS